MRRLTGAQSRVLAFVERWINQRGVGPSVRQISRGLGMRSSSGVQYHLRVLEREGVIARTRSRQIRILRRSEEVVEPLRDLTGQDAPEVLRRLVNAVLPLQSREYLTRAELHWIRQALHSGIAFVQKLDRVDAIRVHSSNGARQDANQRP